MIPGYRAVKWTCVVEVSEWFVEKLSGATEMNRRLNLGTLKKHPRSKYQKPDWTEASTSITLTGGGFKYFCTVFSHRKLGKWSIFFNWLETTHTFNIDLHWTKNAWHLRVQKAQPGGPKLSPSGLVTFLGVSPIPRSWTWDPREETCRKEHGCLGCIRDYTTQIYGDSFTMARWYIGRVCLGYVGMCFLLFHYWLFRAYRGWTPTQAYRDYFHTPLKGSLLNNR